MNIYNLPKFNFQKTNIGQKTRNAGLFAFKKIINIKKAFKNPRNTILLGAVVLVMAGFIAGFLGSVTALNYFPAQINRLAGQFNPIAFNYQTASQLDNNIVQTAYTPSVSYEQAIINTVKSASPSVVSIIISKNVPIYEQQWVNPFGDLGPGFNIQVPQYVQKGTELQEIGAGSGFIVSSDGLVLTNKHVVLDSQAEYTVFTNDGQRYPAKVLALDPVQDLAVAKIQSDRVFKPAVLGDSSKIQIGQTVVAIGNALGQFTNTVSVGVVSGLQRTISASDKTGGFSETLQGIIQTDAAINSGNSGGPLLNLKGEVVGINTAMAEGAQNIGFAIPINMAQRDINQVKNNNKIIYPFLGIRYVSVDSAVKSKYDLPVDYGAYISKGPNGESAITPGSAAESAGLREGDIILEINGEKIDSNNLLSGAILKYNPGDKIVLKILRNGQELSVDVVLGERTS